MSTFDKEAILATWLKPSINGVTCWVVKSHWWGGSSLMKIGTWWSRTGGGSLRILHTFKWVDIGPSVSAHSPRIVFLWVHWTSKCEFGLKPMLPAKCQDISVLNEF